ncbi:hypothetical protein [Pseudomonas sp. JV241A]|uniref:hypothetical protein n=1 Tax=Pseudomonas sp. JV241A TaxID=2078785 RepID=UPI00100D51B3|nr:hypothetical protein [Pseudomonas sp. JV241A]SPO69535.1 protein of unknown function [Pseudomonas sp. JV241A]
MSQGTSARQGLQSPVVLEAVGNNLVDTLERATVQIPAYSQMAAQQLVRMIWDGRRANNQHYFHSEDRVIEADEVGGAIDFIVLAEHIASLNNGTVSVHYRVFDYDSGWHESEYLDLEVGSLELVLPPPLVDESENGRLDPVGLTAATVRVGIYDGMLPGQTVYLECVRTGVGGRHSQHIQVTDIQDLTFAVPVDFITPAVSHNIIFYYWVVEAGVRARYSLFLLLQIRLKTLELQLPSVVQACGGQLDPLLALSGVRIKIRYAHMTTQERITLHWTGTALGSTTLGPLTGDPAGELEFTASPDVVGANIGPSQREVAVRYGVVRLGAEAQESPLLRLGIQPLAGLPLPEVAGAVGSTLDLDRFVGDSAVSLILWRYARAGQRVWLRCHGTKLNGEPDLIELISAGELNEDEAASGLSRVLARNRLLLLRDNSEFRVEFKVSFDQTPQESNAVTFPLLCLTLRTGLRCTVPE